MQGGPELGALGLTRLYALHVTVLPVLLLGALWLRRSVVRRHGWVEASSPSSIAQRVQLTRSVLVGLAIVVVVFSLTGATRGAPLEAPADPMGDYPARPEWFLMTLYELRHFFHGTGEFFGTTLIPGAAGAYLALLPWIDRPGRSRAAFVMAPVVLVFAAAIGLGVLAVRKDAHDEVLAKQRAKADLRAAAAVKLAMGGVPPEGALAMVRSDPELRGRDLFDQHCASCHRLGDLGDPKKATATKLDGWGTAKWIAAMIHDPDAPEFFGRGPYKGDMPSVDVRPKNKPETEKWTPMIKSDADREAVAEFLASQGDQPGDPPRASTEATRAGGEKIVADRCTSCHMYKGDGDVEGSDEAPDLTRYGSLAWTRAQVADPGSESTYRKGAHDPDKKKQMPRFDKDLSPADIELVARWTRAHGRGETLP
jgi:ubiquinol-cytochrome c reductase cytochrome b subunit